LVGVISGEAIPLRRKAANSIAIKQLYTSLAFNVKRHVSSFFIPRKAKFRLMSFKPNTEAAAIVEANWRSGKDAPAVATIILAHNAF
jgi:hypothetical protein